MRLATAVEAKSDEKCCSGIKRPCADIAKSYDFVCAGDSRAAFLPSV
jgi:hypothetical protein